MSPSHHENPDLKRERQNCHFDKEEIINLIDGGIEKTKFRRELVDYILSHEDLRPSTPIENLSHEENYAAELKKACLLIMKFRDRFPSASIDEILRERETNSKPIEISVGMSSGVLIEGHPLGLHFSLFMTTIIGQGTPEQQKKWLPRAHNLEIIGTYAQLYTKGKCEGIHPFLVQLRDENTHEPLPGITLGEIGPKLGLNSNHNGYVGFNQVRIPRDQLLMRNSKVLEDGTYIKPKNTKLTYGTLVWVRVTLVQDMASVLRKAVTIATRYSCVRHQSELKPGEPEPQILDYKAQQNKLFPGLAATFAFQFSAVKVFSVYRIAAESISKSETHLLPELHGLSCALKALSSSETKNFVEIMRKSCGGHGYMICSGFPRLYGVATASETYDGENTILWLQVARYLVKAYMDKVGGESVSYLIDSSLVSNEVLGVIDLSLGSIVSLYKKAAAGLVYVAVKDLQKYKRQGMAPYDAWNQSAVLLIKAAQAHARYFVADCFVRSIKEGNFSPPVRLILTQLCELILVYWLAERSGDFFMYAELKTEQFSQLQTRYMELLGTIRTYAVNLVDSFDFRDEALGSALGCWDGNVYQRLFDEASKSPLNQTAVHKESFEKYLKPLMHSNL